jgi:hypothetical protein
MNSVVIFDISDNNRVEAVRQLMVSKGYYLTWKSPVDRTVYLPHNIVWKPNTETKQAIEDLKQAVSTINVGATGTQIQLLRCVVLNSTPWQAIWGSA